MLNTSWRLILFCSLCLSFPTHATQAETRLLRYPDIHEDTLVFTYAGDLWLASTAGGVARRLTSHPGLEMFAKFSPDGSRIAFTGQYDGDEQVYVIPAEGGEPKQLTYYPAAGPLPDRWGYDNIVYGWTPDGTSILFHSLRPNLYAQEGRLYTVPLEGGLPEPLPMPTAGAGDFSPDGTRIVYSPLFRDFRTWKRYQGGWAQDLHIFDLETSSSTPISPTARTERDPMWLGDTIYFVSDRSGTLNLYAYRIDTADVEQLTHSDVWDVRWPSADNAGHIVYELNGRLRVFDTQSGRHTPVSIDVPTDGVAKRPTRVSVEDKIEDFALSPNGKRVLFVARGDVFSTPVEKGAVRNLTRTPGAHEKRARWTSDGKSVVFISDRDGEEEFYLVAQEGTGEVRQLSDGGEAMRYAPAWSPTGTHLAFSDKDSKLFILDLESGKTTQIADGDFQPYAPIRDYTWSPDGRYLAFSMADRTELDSIYIWSMPEKKLERVTGPYFDEYNPTWDPNGKYLYFLSRRSFAPQISEAEWNYALNRSTGIFAMALREDVAHPFLPESDEAGESGEDEAAAEKADGKKNKRTSGRKRNKTKDEREAPAPIEIQFDGLSERVAPVPVPPHNYSSLQAAGEYLVYLRNGPGFYGRDTTDERTLVRFSIDDREEKDLARGVTGYRVSPAGTHAIVASRDGYDVLEIAASEPELARVPTGGLEIERVPEAEWTQIFDEVWRRFRDFFYVENMHGYDWEALRERYRPWLEHVAHRSDLNYVIGEMIAELNVGHAYIEGGDFEHPRRPDIALPGALLELDRDAGRYRLVRILPGNNEEPRYRSPLTEVGVHVEQGEYLLAIDGVQLLGGDNPYRLLRYKAGHPVRLTVGPTLDTNKARDVIIQPIANEDALAYLAWVAHNRDRVAELSGGRLGYIHIPDMGDVGIQEFIKWFYPQLDKAGLVVDVRGNGGGNVSQWIIERLDRKLLGTGYSRTLKGSRAYPQRVFLGPMACLLNETTCSDGDIFAYMFRKAGLGPVIGKRSWGGVVGITGHGPLIDGGRVYVPQGGLGSTDGHWIVEGHGVDPDIEVEFEPAAVIDGGDPQLERAVEEIMKELDGPTPGLPDRPPEPVKTPAPLPG